jgi:cyclophilin family peptidyl-prolyl cis-trans isomerase
MPNDLHPFSRCSFGYVVEGADFLSDVDEGDIIVSAKVTKGAENLVLPSSTSS